MNKILRALVLTVFLLLLPGTTQAADIPERTWVLLPLAPHAGYETALTPTGGKHISLAWNPDNGRIYVEGGDYYGGSYRQETWSFDVSARLASPTDLAAGWTLEYPFCGPMTQVQPKGPDFVGWTWDTKRHVFWMVPGEMQLSGTQGKVCPSEANLIFRHIMQFDPATKVWTDVAPWAGRDTWSAVYDPKTDTIVHARTDKRIGLYNIAANTWTWPPYLAPTPTPDIQKTIWAADLAGRRLFMVDPGRRTLLRWDMDAHTLTPIGTSPCLVPTTTVQGDKGYLVWDSNAKVMIQVCYNRTGAWAYHPDETPPRWEDLSALPIVGTTAKPHINGLTFDPVKNWLVGIGLDGIWLFRYGQSVAPPSQSPSPPPAPSPPPPAPAQRPTLNSIAPSPVASGSSGFNLAVTGTGFVSGLKATVGGQARTVIFGSATRVTIGVLAADVVNAGNVEVRVTNPGSCAATGTTGTCVSNTMQLVVAPPTPAPAPPPPPPANQKISIQVTPPNCVDVSVNGVLIPGTCAAPLAPANP